MRNTILLGLIVSLLILFPSPSLGGANWVKDVKVRNVEKETLVTITTTSSTPYKHTKFSSKDEVLIVVDIQKAAIHPPRKGFPVSQSVVTRIQLAQYKSDVVRLVAHLTEDSKYSLSQEKEKIILSIANPKGAEPGLRAKYRISKVDCGQIEDKTRVIIVTDSTDSKFRVFTLNKERTIIVDIPNAILSWNGMKTKTREVERGVIKEIRVGQYQTEPPVARVVLDLLEKTPYKVYRLPESKNILIDVTTPPTGFKRREAIKEPPKPEEELISLDLKDADIRGILKVLSLKSGLNIVADETVTGLVTVYLKDVAPRTALELILQAKGFTYQEINGTIMITTPERLKVISILTPEIVSLQYIDAEEVKGMLKGLVSKEGSIAVNKTGNALIINDTLSHMVQIKKLLKEIDRPPRQIMLEARIISVGTDALRDLGFRYGGVTADTRTVTAKFTERSPSEAGITDTRLRTFTRDALEFSVALDMLEDKGKARVLANPRLVTLNNKTAKILIGDRIPYTVTEIVEGAATTEVRFVEVGISLEITPQVSEEGLITTKIKPEVSSIKGWKGPNNEIPWVKTREAEATVRVRDGETIIMGGLLSEDETKTLSKVPILGHIPGLGLLFTRKKTVREKTELVIVVTPRLLTEERAKEITMKEEEKIEEAERKYHRKDWLR